MWPAFGKRTVTLVFFFCFPFQNGDVPQLPTTPFLLITCYAFIELPTFARDHSSRRILPTVVRCCV
jgi:hypothetical protein